MKISFKKLLAAFRRRSRSERGVALIFTLGILGLLMVIALGFASSALTERKIAANNNGNTAAQMLAKSGLERVVAGMNAYMQSSTYYTYPMQNFISRNTDDAVTANQKTFDWLWKLRSFIAYDSAFPSSTGYNANTGVNWQYVTNGLAAAADKELVGRFAYVSIGAGGRLDPSVCVDSVGSTVESNGYVYASSPGYESRLGVDVKEINLCNLAPGYAAYFDKMCSTNATGGTLPVGQRWESYEMLYKSTGLTSVDSSSAHLGIRDTLTKNLKVSYIADPEACYLSGTGDADIQKSVGKYYHRFNMARTDWPTAASAATDAARNSLMNTLMADPTVDTAAFSDSAGIPWLNKWKTPDFTKTCQIAANIIDYCASPDAPVTSGTVAGSSFTLKDAASDWSVTPPAFVGHKKTPLINEVAVVVQGRVDITSTTDGFGNITYNYSYQVVPYVGVEIVDIYGGSQTGGDFTLAPGSKPIAVSLVGRLEYTYNNPVSGPSATQTMSLDTTFNFNGASWVNGYNIQSASFAAAPNPSETTTTSPAPNAAEIGNVKLTIDRLILKYDNRNVVYAAPGNSNDTTALFTGATAGTTKKTKYFDLQADDPRQTLSSSDWLTPGVGIVDDNVSLTSLSAADGGAGYVSYGYANKFIRSCVAANTVSTGITISGSSAGQDVETAADPAYLGAAEGSHLSTAYVRGGTMQSPWELGCIHRGGKWQTLNLTAYDSAASPTFAYANGDASILDQVKFTTATKTFGKVNLNGNNADVFRALFANIYIRKNDPSAGTSIYADPGSKSGDLIDPAIADAMAAKLLAANGSLGGQRFMNRAAILRSSNGLRQDFCSNGGASTISGLTLSTKSAKEQLVAKFINLTKAEPADTVTVIVLAQSLKDIGGRDVYKDWLNDGTMSGEVKQSSSDAQKRTYGYVSFDGSSTPDISTMNGAGLASLKNPVATVKGQYDIGIDSITGESKLIATLAWDPTSGTSGAWDIQRMEYTDN